MARTILHVDMDAFFASVEQLDHPGLKGLPVVVGAPPDQRGVVAAASYEARRFGIHSAMPSREAGRRCPHAVFRPVNMERYAEVSRGIFAILGRFTPHVEPLSIDEAFLDVTGALRLFGPGPAIAAAIRKAIREETGLTASAGVAGNKFLAKLASDLHKPDGLTVAPEGREAVMAFLAPMDVGRMWGVGAVTRRQLEAAGIRTIGDLQRSAEARVAAVVGRHAARHLLRLAAGDDDREVEPAAEEKSISREHTFPRDCRSPDELAATLCDLAEDVGARLRASGRYAALARLKLRWAGFETLTRQAPLVPPACDDFALRTAALALLRAQPLVKPVRLIGFGLARLGPPPTRQLELFVPAATAPDRREHLSQTVDRLRRRFGGRAIRRGSGGIFDA